jgi:UV DNA damage endonuclease
MRVGYACQTIGVRDTDYRTCLAKNASPDVLQGLIAHNLGALANAIRYNIRSGILLFRITSDLIPFGSSPVNPLAWTGLFAGEFARIGDLIRSSGMRVSMHPGQYTVLNSPNPDIARRAADDLAYHADVLDSMGLDASHKIILHIGGIYQDRAAALERFAQRWQQLDARVRNRLVIENDDKCYTIEDVLAVGSQLGIPVVFDNLHHQLNHRTGSPDDRFWIEQCRPLWRPADGPQKIHFSQQDPVKKGGSHAPTIRTSDFVGYCRGLARDDLDIMLEVKDKNLSAVKCQLGLAGHPRRQDLENEWARYKYVVLEHAPADYQAIRQLLNRRGDVPVLEFYDLLEKALATEVNAGHAENAALHVWGYFKDQATETEKKAVLRGLEKYRAGTVSLAAVKKALERLAVTYQQDYLLNCYYFFF